MRISFTNATVTVTMVEYEGVAARALSTIARCVVSVWLLAKRRWFLASFVSPDALACKRSCISVNDRFDDVPFDVVEDELVDSCCCIWDTFIFKRLISSTSSTNMSYRPEIFELRTARARRTIIRLLGACSLRRASGRA